MNDDYIKQLDESVPHDLKNEPRWIGSLSKQCFIDVKTGRWAKPNDPETWSIFSDCCDALKNGRHDINGLDFVAGGSFVILDLDGCMVKRGTLCPLARKIVHMMESYTELSRSGTGLHIYIRAASDRPNYKFARVCGMRSVEIFNRNHFVNATGQKLFMPSKVEDRTHVLLELIDELKSSRSRSEQSTPVDRTILEDQEIIAQLSTNQKFMQLWEGNINDYPSASEADFALASLIAFYTGDEEQIARLMSESPLKRDKWKRTEYLDKTIRSAIRVVGKNVSRRKTTQIVLDMEFTEAPVSAGCNRTDSGNADRLVNRHGEDLHFCHPQNLWYSYNEICWCPDRRGQVIELAKEVATSILDEAKAHPDREKRRLLIEHALRSECASRLRATVDLAKSVPPIPILPEEFNSDPMLLNVKNGTIDLRSGDLLPHKRSDLITKIAPVEYYPDADSRIWRRFLEQTCGNDAELIAFLKRAIGYSLTGSTAEEILVLLLGPGAAGKSTFIEAIKAMLGDYAVVAAFDTFIARKSDSGPRNDIARLVGARFVCASESEEGKRWAVGTLKQLTGGDTISARFLYQEEFEFRPAFKLWLVANDAPEARATDDALWRRILRVPFEHVVPKERRDPQLKRALTSDPEHLSAILAWAVEGCLEYQEKGLGVPPIVEAATKEYRADNDPLAEFFMTHCRFAPELFESSALLYLAYENWAHTNGVDPVARTTFTRLAKQHPDLKGITKKIDKKATRCLSGLELNTHY